MNWYRIFLGYNELRTYQKQNIPLSYYRKWLKEKWKHDLHIVGYVIVFSPLLIFGVVASLLATLTDSMVDLYYEIADYIPNSLRVTDEGMTAVVREVNQYEKNRDSVNS